MKIKNIENRNDIIRLWQEAFGDSREDIDYFIDNVRDSECIGCFEDERAVSMLYLVDCNYKMYTASYVYAACTERASRGMGYMSALLEHCRRICNGNLCLIPANQGLVDYYKKNNLSTEIDINDIAFYQTDEICDYLFEGCELAEPFGLLYSKGD